MRVLSPKETSSLLGIDKKTLYSHLKAGRLPARKLGRRWFLTEEAVRRFLEGQAVSAGPQPGAAA